MASRDELRLLTKVARLKYERNLSQAEIAERLEVSQSTISRLLKRALEEGTVRIMVTVPNGVYPELEEGLQDAYGLKEAVVVDSADDDQQVIRDMGAAAAYYLETTVKLGDVVGISSWSATLLAMVNAMQPLSRPTGARVVQILGGVGNPSAEVHAAHLTRRLANLLHGEAIFLPAPGVVGSEESRAILLQDPYVGETVKCFDELTLALVGIGTVEPSRLLASSGNIFSRSELDHLRQVGAVGDVCLRFFDAEGVPVETQVERRVVGITVSQLKKIHRAVAIAGGPRKTAALRGALTGRLVNVLITDQFTAQRLLAAVP